MNKFNENTQNNEIINETAVIEKIYAKNTMPDARMLVFMTGFCLGMVFFYLCKSTGKNENPFDAVLSTERLEQLDSFLAYKVNLFEYIAGVRIGQLVLLMLCAASSIAAVLAYGIFGLCGFELGLMSFAAVYQYGILGLVFVMAMLLPHGIFYIGAILALFGSNSKPERQTDKSKWHKRFDGFKKIAAVFLIFFAGILSEVYINSEILRKIAIFLSE